MGVARGSVNYRLIAGHLHRVHRRVYAVGHSRLTRNGRFMAAVLACGPGAVVSHRSAAALLDLRPTSAPTVDITAAFRTIRSRPGIHAHTGALLDRDTVEVQDVPCTSTARTLLDLAGVLDPRSLQRALERAETLRTLDLDAINDLLERSNGHHGARKLDHALARYRPDIQTRSELEAVFLDLCTKHSLPSPVVNGRVQVGAEGFEVDFHWPGHRLVVEVDGFEHHGTRTAFEQDRARDQLLTSAGYRVVRFTWRQVRDDPGGVAGVVRAIVVSSGAQAAV